jgi:hypothetical protein
MSDQQFFFDEFFGEDDGVEILLPVRGKKVPIRIRRGLPLQEKLAAQSAAIKRKINPVTGKIEVDRIEEGAAARELAFRMLLDWPFTYRETGEKVPITRENVDKLLGGMDKLIELVGKLDEEGEAALAPFALPSAEA